MNTYTQKAIKHAQLGRYKPTTYQMKEWSTQGIWVENPNAPGFVYCLPRIMLDTAFWEALGKYEGWKEKGRITVYQYDGVSEKPVSINWSELDMWRVEMHRLIDHLADGGDIESYFEQLLEPTCGCDEHDHCQLHME